jgi:hypothetical protein
MKHEREIKAAPRPTWRLKKTLARKVDFRPIEQDDIKYAYVAYKKGLLASMGERWASGEMDPATFAKQFEAEVITVYHAAWTLMAESRKGYMPVAIVLGFYSHPLPQLAPFMIVGDMIWFPWATARNKIESAVAFFSRIRNEIPMVEYASEQHKRFFEMICQHGVMRRIGTMHHVYPGQLTAVFETRQG